MHRHNMVRNIGSECVQENELEELLKNVANPIVYDGFEPSGRMHIAQGLIRVFNANTLIDQGCKVVFVIADWFAFMNLKFGGDLEKIKNAGRLFIHIWKACGIKEVKYVWTSDMISDPKYWQLVLEMSTKFNVSRIVKCTQIMGRNEKDTLTASQIFYPVMQASDIFYLNADICNLGGDQRKVNMLAREYAQKVGITPPIILSNNMLIGLTGKKMSKSDPNSAIFMDDSEEDIRNKIKKAFCPPRQIEDNPILEYIKLIIIPQMGQFNGFQTYKEIESLYLQDKLDIKLIKEEVAKCINGLLEPVRKYFSQNAEARELAAMFK